MKVYIVCIPNKPFPGIAGVHGSQLIATQEAHVLGGEVHWFEVRTRNSGKITVAEGVSNGCKED